MENFALATVSVAWSILFLKMGVTDGEIGIIKGYSIILVLLISLLLPRLLEKFDESKVYPATLSFTAAFLLLAGLPSILAITLSFLFIRLLQNIKISSFSIMFRDTFRKQSEYSLAQGVMSGLMAFAWLVGPFLGGLYMDKFGAPKTMVLGACIIALAAIVSLLKRKSHETKVIQSSFSPIKNIRFFTSISGMKLAYLMRAGVDIWWAFTFTFLPLYMVRSGYSFFEIGLALSLTQLPLVIGEFITVRALNVLSFRSIFALCYFYLFLISVLCFFAPASWMVIALLVLGAVALSFLEPLTEIYFFKLSKKDEEERAYPIFITSSALGEGLLTLTTGVVLTIFSFKYGFSVLSISMLAIFLMSRSIKKTAS